MTTIHISQPRTVLLAVMCLHEHRGDQIAFENGLYAVEVRSPVRSLAETVWNKFNRDFFELPVEQLSSRALAVAYRDITRQPAEYAHWNPSHPENHFFVNDGDGPFLACFDREINPKHNKFKPETVCDLLPDMFIDKRKRIKSIGITSVFTDDNITEFRLPVYPGQTLLSNATGKPMAKIGNNGMAQTTNGHQAVGIHQRAETAQPN